MSAIVVLDDYQRVAKDCADWSPLAPMPVLFVHEPLRDAETVVRTLQDASVVVALRERTRLSADILSRLPHLRLIVTMGGSNAAIDHVSGVTVSGTRSLSSPTAELTWALILAARRNLLEESRALREGRWQTRVGTGLEGAVLGVVGLGNLGSRVAKIGAAFGMRVRAWSPRLTPERAAAAGAEAVSKRTLFETSDVVSVHLRAGPRSVGIVDADAIGMMGPSSLLVNTSRAAIVDMHAVQEALRSGRLGGAAIDVFSTEPLEADDPVLELPRALLTPHIGFVVRQNYELFYGDAVESILAYLDGSPIRVIHPAH